MGTKCKGGPVLNRRKAKQLTKIRWLLCLVTCIAILNFFKSMHFWMEGWKEAGWLLLLLLLFCRGGGGGGAVAAQEEKVIGILTTARPLPRTTHTRTHCDVY